MTRRSSYRSLASLQRDCRRCRACTAAGFPLESGPAFEGDIGQRAMIVGQAPGIVEGIEGRPWRGRAGATLRRWLEMDEPMFYATFYCTSMTRCYPGRDTSGRGDRLPTRKEVALCRDWLEWELRLLRPTLVVTVGGLAARHLLGLPRLTEHVGTRIPFGDAIAVPLPHPSGASGWLNIAENRARLQQGLRVVTAMLASPSASERGLDPDAEVGEVDAGTAKRTRKRAGGRPEHA
jgi:uracil-DNA glycosylase